MPLILALLVDMVNCQWQCVRAGEALAASSRSCCGLWYRPGPSATSHGPSEASFRSPGTMTILLHVLVLAALVLVVVTIASIAASTNTAAISVFSHRHLEQKKESATAAPFTFPMR